jgi:hypothetical protein
LAFFGWDEPQDPSLAALPYKVAFVVEGDGGVKSELQDSSNFFPAG